MCASSTGKTQGKDSCLSSEVARLRNHDGPWTISLFTLLRFLLLFSSPPSLYSEHRTSVHLSDVKHIVQESMILEAGYEAEAHKVVTDDDYILTVYR